MPAAKPPRPSPSGDPGPVFGPSIARLLVAVGQRVRDLRKARGLSQEEFARQSGTARTYIGPVERGTKNLSLETLTRFAAVLGVDVADLIPREDELDDLTKGSDAAGRIHR